MNTTSHQIVPGHAKVNYQTANVDGLEIFYREAGEPGNPAILFLHGFPTSSHMFREILPVLGTDSHVLAPDYPGFGYSSAPSAESFNYTFARVADVMEKFLLKVGFTRFAIFMQDYGSPVGFRIATRHPEWVRALIIQNANAYREGISGAFEAFKPFWQDRNAETEKPIRDLLTLETTRFQYIHGARNLAAISPDNWHHDQALLNRPGNDRIQLALLHDYQNNPPIYSRWQEYLRQHHPPMLITWGKNDPFFTEAGAKAYLKDLPKAELHFLDTGHFALEEDGLRIAALIREFMKRLK